MSKNKAAVDRWFLTIHNMARIATQQKSMVGLKDSQQYIGTNSHTDSIPSRMR